MNIAELLDRAGRTRPENLALAEGTRPVARYGALAARATGLAGGLSQRLGLAPDQRVALIMGNCSHYVEALFAVWHAGLVAVPTNAKLHPKELAYILDNSGARLCFVTEELAEAVAGLKDDLSQLEHVICVTDRDYAGLAASEPVPMVERAPDDLAWLFYTSGTTGRPKGAMLTHRNLLAAALAYFSDVDTVAPEDCILHAAPMSHGSGIYILPHVAQMAAQVTPESRKFDPAEIFDLCRHYSGVAMFAAPTMVKRLTDHASGHDVGAAGLKTIAYGGGPMYLADLKAAHACLGHRLAQIYGQAETPMTVTAMSKAMHAELDRAGDDARLASAGIPYAGIEVRVVDAGDEPVAVGEPGQVVVRGDTVMRGYWRNPDATAATLKGDWLHTGDIGVFDKAGFLTLKDRSTDLIISGGANIYPREVEDVLLLHEGVAEAAVLGRPHPDWGEETVAFVVAREGAEVGADALDQHCLGHIARFKRPRHYLFVDALPKNNYGKIVKTELRDKLNAMAAEA